VTAKQLKQVKQRLLTYFE